MKKEAHVKGINVRSILQVWITEIDSDRVFGLLPKTEYLVSITDYKLTRSIAQNNLMWLWIDIVCEKTGYTKNEFHSYVNSTFITQTEKEIMGKLTNTSKTTSKLNTKEFSEMLVIFEQHVNEFLDIILPRPSDLYDLSIYGAIRKK